MSTQEYEALQKQFLDKPEIKLPEEKDHAQYLSVKRDEYGKALQRMKEQKIRDVQYYKTEMSYFIFNCLLTGNITPDIALKYFQILFPSEDKALQAFEILKRTYDSAVGYADPEIGRLAMNTFSVTRAKTS